MGRTSMNAVTGVDAAADGGARDVEHSVPLGAPVLLFGHGISAIGALRSLARSGVTVYPAIPDPDFVGRSRFRRALPESTEEPVTPSTLANWLVGLSLPHAVLMPCADDWAMAVATLPPSLARRFPSSSPSADAIATCTNKWQFARVLATNALPHPQTVLLSSMDDLERLPNEAFVGRFLKPLDSLSFSTRHKVKAFLIDSKKDARDVMRRGEEEGVSDFPILLQEYVPGDPTNHYFVDGFIDRTGDIRALFARKRLRMFPPLLGNSTLMESVPVDEVAGAVDTLRRLFAVMRYRGIFSAELKFDARDKRFKILEVNARPWWYVEFASRSGVNVCRMAYDDALRAPVETPPPYRPGRRCVYLVNDFKAIQADRRGTMSWVRSWIGADETVLALDDPWPGLTHLFNAVSKHLHGTRT